MVAGMGFCSAKKPLINRLAHSTFMMRGFPRAYLAIFSIASAVKTVSA
jgi:hypothetical protein